MLPVAKEFQTFFVLITLILISFYFITGLPNYYLWGVWLLFLLFIRDFRREIPPIPQAVISPVDGRILETIETQDPFLNRLSVRYTISQFVWGEFNVHSPVEGRVDQLWVENTEKQKKCLAFCIRSDEEGDVVVEIELNSPIQHASTHIHPGERVGQGKRCGFAAMGCMVHVYLPKTAKLIGQMDSKALAGRDILANLISLKNTV